MLEQLTDDHIDAIIVMLMRANNLHLSRTRPLLLDYIEEKQRRFFKTLSDEEI